MIPKLTGLFVCIAMIVLLVGAVRADIIKLKDGRTIEGEVTEETSTTLRIRLKLGYQTFKRSEIASITKQKTDRQIFAERHNNLRSDDSEGHFQLAVWAERKGMATKAKSLFRRTLILDPDHSGARGALGEKKVDGKWLPIAEADVVIASREKDALLAKGYIQHEGVWRSPEEMEKIRMGLIDHDGVWMTPEEKTLREKGFVRFKNRWVTKDERTMLARGFVMFRGKWVKKSDMLAKRVDWVDAWEMVTPHYQITTNINEELCDDLAALMEAAYLEYLRIVGVEPKDGAQMGKQPNPNRRMPIYIFSTKEEYNEYCRANKMANNAHLDGFYNARRNLVATWSGNNLEFIRRFVVSLGFWQYYFNSVGNGLPSWLSEGMAGYFNACFWDEKTLKVGMNDSAQLRFLKKLKDKHRIFTPNELITEDLHSVIQRGDFKRFAAQSYAIVFYLLRGPNESDRAQFRTFLERLRTEPFVLGNTDILGAQMLRSIFGGRSGIDELFERAYDFVFTIGRENTRVFPSSRFSDDQD